LGPLSDGAFLSHSDRKAPLLPAAAGLRPLGQVLD
jgi:hypothetical protein